MKDDEREISPFVSATLAILRARIKSQRRPSEENKYLVTNIYVEIVDDQPKVKVEYEDRK